MARQTATAMPGGTFGNTPGSREEDLAGYRIVWAGPHHPERESLQRFIGARFQQMHGARLHHFCGTLAGWHDNNGGWIAAVGYTPADGSRLFLEQYLDAPIETSIALHARVPVRRHQIVEVGNLAALRPGAARSLIVAMTRHLHDQGLRWVGFTANQALRNAFLRLDLQPLLLAPADPARLPQEGRDWGAYFATRPQVMCGNIGSGYAHLAD